MKLAKIMRKISLPLVILLGVIFIFFINTNEEFTSSTRPPSQPCTNSNCARSGGTFYNGICYGSCPSGYGVSNWVDCKFKGTRADATSIGKPFFVARRTRTNDCL